MDKIRQYLLSVLVAAILCAMITRILSNNSSTNRLVKLISTLFFATTMLSPILNLQFGDVSSWLDGYESAAGDLVAEGTRVATDEKIEIIKENTEAYVLEKAAGYGVDLDVAVKISDPVTLLPDQITLRGNISPRIRQLLQNCIAEDLGIPKENQVWK